MDRTPTEEWWCLAYTEAGKEDFVEAALKRSGAETYCPRYAIALRRGHRSIPALLPLFPRYVFARGVPASTIRWCVGVSDLVSAGETTALINPAIVDEIALREVNGTVPVPTPQAPRKEFEKGESIRMRAGAFSGVKGVFECASGEERVAILLSAAGRKIRVTANRRDIEKDEP